MRKMRKMRKYDLLSIMQIFVTPTLIFLATVVWTLGAFGVCAVELCVPPDAFVAFLHFALFLYVLDDAFRAKERREKLVAEKNAEFDALGDDPSDAFYADPSGAATKSFNFKRDDALVVSEETFDRISRDSDEEAEIDCVRCFRSADGERLFTSLEAARTFYYPTKVSILADTSGAEAMQNLKLVYVVRDDFDEKRIDSFVAALKKESEQDD